MMRIIYPYNEILPKKSAHDIYIINNCLSLQGAHASVELLCGLGSLSDGELAKHYHAESFGKMQLTRLPILRKNLGLSFSWNTPFHFFSQRAIDRKAPDIVICSVLKQARYHFFRRIPNVRYVYEVHQLTTYSGEDTAKVRWERKILNRADLLTVTTQIMKDLLLKPPYSLTTQIEVVPLAVKGKALTKPRASRRLKCTYVGQLYEGQGLPLLLKALLHAPNWELDVIGGKAHEIATLKVLAQELGVLNRVNFHGFIAPSKLRPFLEPAHVFVAPFTSQGRMPYVAHTKIMEYIRWARPTILPDLASVREHVTENMACRFFKVGDALSLAQAMKDLENGVLRQSLQETVSRLQNVFSWEERSQNYFKFLCSLCK